jgi:hypothetical protein
VDRAEICEIPIPQTCLLQLTIIAVCVAAAAAQDDGWYAGRNQRSSRAVVEVPVATTVCASSANGVTYCSSTPGCTGASTFVSIFEKLLMKKMMKTFRK